MVTLSLCMIVRDEEDVLGRCLESVKDLAESAVNVGKEQVMRFVYKPVEQVEPTDGI